MDLNDARILVVGATGVLGQRLCERLSEHTGNIVVTGRSSADAEQLRDRLGARAAHALDLVDHDAAAAVVRTAAEELGGFDAVVVATGVAAFGPAAEEDEAVVEELFEVNALGPMAVVRAALPHLVDGGAVAVLTGVVAELPLAGMGAYAASKAAMASWLGSLRRELRSRRIAVVDARLPHMDTGLVDRALAGLPPALPPGHNIDDVIAALERGLERGAREVRID
ncbi:SDR family NAD(P)-dependent oxidoreductase [Kocuria sediminis]|uniref:SDR family NAD(P)-dependent oxidoreductase n=1 Tax=Kocuria sediminis TaxID=1038857 RepID=A0A6N8GP36_9MICC|nr:SDR family NAD(P)-dependent oxidoreductase [Kocuria sediminis]MUN64841.1 SDR family NAD(P)-dependent oxidoreductase [Kocuria sediminis]